MKKTFCTLMLLAPLFMTAACGPGDSGNAFTEQYLAAQDRFPGARVQPEWLDDFIAAYGDFTGEHLKKRIKRVYAPELYFNDTLRSIGEREHLVEYLSHSASRLEDMELDILGKHYDGRDAWLRWTLRTRFSVGWRDVDTTTLGMSHLRFNEDGEVILHQDFWDSRQGIFEHIPVLGGTINWVRKRL